MMRRGRIVDALVCLLATWAAILPLRSLFATLDWVNPAIGLSLVVVAVGSAGRMFLPSRWGVVGLQFAAAVATISALHLRGHLWHGIPLKDAALALNSLLYQARVTVVTFSAPAPMNRGMIVALTVVVGLLVLAVDAAGVTFGSPALAGLPLLAAYLITATNTGTPLAWYSFVLPAALWLTMVARAGVEGLHRWATAVPLRDGGGRGRDGVDGFSSAARNLGVAAVITALLIAWAVPHPATRFLGDGLGRAASGDSGGGSFELSTTLDLTRSLEDQSDVVVFRYHTSATAVAPLRIAVLGKYDTDGTFSRQRAYPATVLIGGDPILGLPDLSQDAAQVTTSTFSVDASRLGAPQIALPDLVTELDLPEGVGATRFPDGTIDVSNRVRTYGGTVVTVTPTTQQLERSDVHDDVIDLRANVKLPDADSLTVEPRAQERLRATLDRIVPKGASDFDAAVAIQTYLRSSDFTYSLTLAADPTDEQGRPLDLDPVSRFLVTRVGFCQQFATAMIMLARERGIPARMVIGFLPGTLENGVRTVRGADAHAWPELFFEPFGWLRFEPTPGSQSGSVPSYAHAPVTPSASPSGSSTARPAQRPDVTERQQPGRTADGLDKPVWQRVDELPTWLWVLLAGILGVLGVLAVPVSARLGTRRRLARAPDPSTRVEVRWRDLADRLADLGVVAPESLTPRQAEVFVADRGVLDPEQRQAMSRVVASLERARYAPPTATLDDPADDVDRVVSAVAASRRWPTRLRARILPAAGRRAIGDVATRVVTLPRRLMGRGRDVITRLTGRS